MNDAVSKVPSIEQEMSQFKGFSTMDGVTQDPGKSTTRAATGSGRAATVATSAQPAETVVDETAGAEADQGADGEQEEVQEDHGQPRKPKSAQERIDQAVGRQRAAERRSESLQRAVDSMTARLDALERRPLTETAANVKPKTDPNAPRPDDYDYGDLDSRFIADLARHEARKELLEEQTRANQRQQTAQQTAAQREFSLKLNEFQERGAEKYEDFAETVIESGLHSEWPLSEALASLAIESEHGPEILYGLATDVREARKINGLTPAQQAAWFGRREAELGGVTTKPAQGDEPAAIRRVSQAPTPLVNRARGSGGSKAAVKPETTDFAAFEALAMNRNRN